MKVAYTSSTLLAGLWAALCITSVYAYEVSISEADNARQFCSGMWSGKSTYINISFAEQSRGQVAVVVYEWSDVDYLGKVTSQVDDSIPRIYVCTSDAMRQGFCSSDELGRFITELPSGVSLNSTSIWTAPVILGNHSQSSPPEQTAATSLNSLLDNPAGNPVLPDDTSNHAPLAFRRSKPDSVSRRQSNDQRVIQYTSPLNYPINKSGYYCAAVIPLSTLGDAESSGNTIVVHPTFEGQILFQNVFKGHLPASDYPKVEFYFALLLLYAVLGCTWGLACYRYRAELLPIQYYLSSLVAFVLVQVLASWVYYRYLNSHGTGLVSTIFLFVVAFLDAGRNSLSLFLLLIVSLGLSVVKESLGHLMTRCWMLAVVHFVFGVLYSVGIVELELESTSALVLLIFIVPLAFTLSDFLFWIMLALNTTTSQLQARRQYFKLGMFKRLYYILMSIVALIGIFFVLSSLSFSNRLHQSRSALHATPHYLIVTKIMQLILGELGGSFSMDILFCCTLQRSLESFIYGVQPKTIEDECLQTFSRLVLTGHFTLAMSEELAQDENDAAEYDLATMHPNDEDENNLSPSRRSSSQLPVEHVVFEVTQEDPEDSGEERAMLPKRPTLGL